MVRRWLTRTLITRNLDALNAGDVRPMLRMEAPAVHFRFPGRSSWAVDITGRDQVRAWLTRMVGTGLEHHLDDIVVQGPPWHMTAVLRGTDTFAHRDGTPVYDNRYVIWAVTRWGRICDYEVYEDTEKVADFDDYLSRQPTT